MTNDVQILGFEERFRDAFYSVNLQWLEEYFTVTDGDLDILRHPEAILSGGGEIFFALSDGVVIGTCAMICHGDEFELAKMGVLPALRRTGCGTLLLKQSLAFAKAAGAKQVFLETSRRLPHAIALYEKSGFVREGEEYIHPVFGRLIFKMVKIL